MVTEFISDWDSLPKVQVTIKEAYEALAKNGFDHLRGDWVTLDSDGRVFGGCAMGQMAVNLGVVANGSIADEINKVAGSISEKQIPKKLLDTYNIDTKTDMEYESNRGIATMIIRLNDAYIYENGGRKYIFTWREIVKYAKKWLEPHFDKTVTFNKYEFKLPEANNG